MEITEFKKFITCNIISIIGYLGFLMTIVFLIMFILGASGIGIQTDTNEYFYDYLSKYVISPYFGMYKFQLMVIVLLIIGYNFENKHYIENNEPGLILFPEKEKLYSIIFSTGAFLNILPIFVLIITSILVNFKLL